MKLPRVLHTVRCNLMGHRIIPFFDVSFYCSATLEWSGMSSCGYHMATTLVTADPVESHGYHSRHCGSCRVSHMETFLCRVVFMQDAFDFFVYFGVLDFGHVRVRRPMRIIYFYSQKYLEYVQPNI